MGLTAPIVPGHNAFPNSATIAQFAARDGDRDSTAGGR